MELRSVKTPGLEIGAQAPDFNLESTDGKQYSLSMFQARHLVIVFMSNGCPTVRAYKDRLFSIQRDYGPKGTQLLGINSNNDHLSAIDSFEEMVNMARGFNFPYLKDPDGSVARRYEAICTPHVFLLDTERKVRYKGRIDDARHESRVTSTDLMNALDDLLAGVEERAGIVKVPETEPFGCSIVW